MSDNPLRTFLATYPRMIGVSFLLVLLLAQAQPVAAGATYCHGP